MNKKTIEDVKKRYGIDEEIPYIKKLLWRIKCKLLYLSTKDQITYYMALGDYKTTGKLSKECTELLEKISKKKTRRYKGLIKV